MTTPSAVKRGLCWPCLIINPTEKRTKSERRDDMTLFNLLFSSVFDSKSDHKSDFVCNKPHDPKCTKIWATNNLLVCVLTSQPFFFSFWLHNRSHFCATCRSRNTFVACGGLGEPTRTACDYSGLLGSHFTHGFSYPYPCLLGQDTTLHRAWGGTP